MQYRYVDPIIMQLYPCLSARLHLYPVRYLAHNRLGPALSQVVGLLLCPSVCRPCPLTLSVACACGAATRSLPCGAEGRAVPPPCVVPCPVSALCRHASQLPRHRCHYGPCPPCPAPCGTKLPCDHLCASAGCHDPVPPSVVPFTKPVPLKHTPAAMLAAAQAANWTTKGDGQSNGHRKSNGHGHHLELLDKLLPGGLGGGMAAEAKGGVNLAAMAAEESAALLAQQAGQPPMECPPCQTPQPVWCVGGHIEQVGGRGV